MEYQNVVAPYSGAHAQLTPVIMRMCVKYLLAGAKNIKCVKENQEKSGGNQQRSTTFSVPFLDVSWKQYCGYAQQRSMVMVSAPASTIQKFLSYHSTILLPFCDSR